MLLVDGKGCAWGQGARGVFPYGRLTPCGPERVPAAAGAMVSWGASRVVISLQDRASRHRQRHAQRLLLMLMLRVRLIRFSAGGSSNLKQPARIGGGKQPLLSKNGATQTSSPTSHSQLRNHSVHSHRLALPAPALGTCGNRQRRAGHHPVQPSVCSNPQSPPPCD